MLWNGLWNSIHGAELTRHADSKLRRYLRQSPVTRPELRLRRQHRCRDQVRIDVANASRHQTPLLDKLHHLEVACLDTRRQRIE
jgi:hypothetical protein